MQEEKFIYTLLLKTSCRSIAVTRSSAAVMLTRAAWSWSPGLLVTMAASVPARGVQGSTVVVDDDDDDDDGDGDGVDYD